MGGFQHLPRFRSIREAPWMQIFVFFLAYVTTETKRSFWIWNIPASRELSRENTRKNTKFLAFKLSLQEILLKKPD